MIFIKEEGDVELWSTNIWKKLYLQIRSLIYRYEFYGVIVYLRK